MSTRRTSTTSVIVSVTPANDNPPIIENPDSYNRTIEEDYAVNKTIITVIATDSDRNNDGGIGDKDNVLTFSIIAGDEANPRFAINPQTGAIYAVRSLDRDTSNYTSYNLTVLVEDGGTTPSQLSATTFVYIYLEDVNDNRPDFTAKNQERTISEDEPIGYVADTIRATDPDRGENSTIVYNVSSTTLTLVNGTKVTIDYDIFEVNSTSGAVSLARRIDRERFTTVVVVFSAEDLGPIPQGSLTTYTYTVCDYNDNIPMFTQPDYFVNVVENSLDGTPVFTVDATDGDLGSSCPSSLPGLGDASNLNYELRYSIVGGNTGMVFAIDPITGNITVSGMLNRENTSLYVLNLSVTDLGTPPLGSLSQITINVTDGNDHSPVFVNDTLYESIPENAVSFPQGGAARFSQLAIFSATDSDIGTNGFIYYEITGGDPDNSFRIGRKNGSVTVVKDLDRERRDFYALTITAFDEGLPQLSTNATLFVTVLDANEEPPNFTLPVYILEVPETALQGEVVYVINATDSDIGENGRITYSFISRNDSGMFSLNNSTGEVRSTVSSLCRRDNISYSFTIQATDNAGIVDGQPQKLSNVINATLVVYDVNDFNPQISASQTFIYASPVANQTLITTINSTDMDSCDKGVTLSLSGPNSDDFFLDPNTNRLMTVARLFTNRIRSYRLTITSRDSGSLKIRQSQTQINIVVGLRVPITYSVTRGSAFLQGRAAFTPTPGQVVQEMTYFQPGTSSIVESAFSSLTVLQSLQLAPEPPVEVRAQFLSPNQLWPDMRAIRVAMQSVDVNNHAAGTGLLYTEIQNGNGMLLNASCAPTAPGFSCVAQALLPETWFGNVSVSSTSVSVYVHSTSITSRSRQLLGTVMLQQRRALPAADAIAILPTRSLSNGEAFQVAVMSANPYALTYFQVEVRLPAGIGSPQIDFDNTQWAVTTTSLASSPFTVTGISKAAASPARVASHQSLFTIRLAVAPVTSITSATIALTVARMDNIFSTHIFRGNMHHVWRDPSSTADGLVFIDQQRVVALVPYVDNAGVTNAANILNVNALNPAQVSFRIARRFVYNTGAFGVSSGNDITCSGRTESLFEIQADCVIRLKPSVSVQFQTECVTVSSTTVGVMSRQVCFNIATPHSYSTSVTDTELNAVSTIMDSSCSTQAYQSGTLTLWASVDSNSISHRVDLTSYALSRGLFQANPAGIVAFDGRSVTGISPGVATITVLGVQTAPLDVTVSVTPVDVLAVELTDASFLRFSPPNLRGVTGNSADAAGSGVVANLSSVFVAEATLDRSPLEYPSQRLHTEVAAVFSDGYRQVLPADATLQPTIFGGELATVGSTTIFSGQIQAQFTGQASYAYTWLPGCGSDNWTTPLSTVDVQFTTPRVLVLNSNPLLVRSNDVASDRFSQNTTITIYHEYRDSSGNVLYRRQIPIDEAIFAISTGLKRTGGSVFKLILAADPATQSFSGVISMSFSFDNVQSVGQTNVTVLRTDLSFAARPFPAYSGSSSVAVSTISRIGQSSVLQQFQVVLNEVVSYDTGSGSRALYQTIDVSSSALAEYRLLAAGRSALHSQQSSVVDPNTLSPLGFDFSANTSIDIEPFYKGSPRTALTQTLQVVTTGLYVTSISNFAVVDGGSSCQSSLPCQLQLSFTLNNGQFFSDYFNSSSGVLASGLFTITSSDTLVASVGANGMVTLLRNSAPTVTITATSTGNGIVLSRLLDLTSNIDPTAPYDVDLGDSNGPLVADNRVGGVFSLPVRLNMNNAILGTVQITLQYNASQLDAVSVVAGPGWPGGPLFSRMHTPDGQVSFGGVAVNHAPAAVIEIAIISFRSLLPGLVRLSGTIDLLTAPPMSFGVVQVHASDQAISAGDIVLQFTGTPVATPPTNSLVPSPQRRSPCATSPCNCGSTADYGDLDGDCVFDLRDVSLVQFAVQNNGTLGVVASFFNMFRHIVDCNLDTSIDMNDVEQLVKINFGLAYFVLRLDVIPVQNNSPACLTAVTATLVNSNSVSLLPSASLVMSLASVGSEVRNNLGSHDVQVGSFKGVSPTGVLISLQAQADGNYTAAINARFTSSTMGYAFVMVTQDGRGNIDFARTSFLQGPRTSTSSGLFQAINTTITIQSQPVVVRTIGKFNPIAGVVQNLTTAACSNTRQPTFYPNVTQISLFENTTVGTIVVRLNATDPDNFSTPVAYGIRSGNSGSTFELNTTTGDLVLVESLDREATGMYSLVVVAYDSGVFFRLEGTADVYIRVLDINDNDPVFNSSTYMFASQAEDVAIGTSLGRVYATDGDIGVNGDIVYTVESGDCDSVFLLNSTTGVLSVARSLDYERQVNFTLKVNATDRGIPVRWDQATIDFSVYPVNDLAPVCSPLVVSERIRVSAIHCPRPPKLLVVDLVAA